MCRASRRSEIETARSRTSISASRERMLDVDRTNDEDSFETTYGWRRGAACLAPIVGGRSPSASSEGLRCFQGAVCPNLPGAWLSVEAGTNAFQGKRSRRRSAQPAASGRPPKVGRCDHRPAFTLDGAAAQQLRPANLRGCSADCLSARSNAPSRLLSAGTDRLMMRGSLSPCLIEAFGISSVSCASRFMTFGNGSALLRCLSQRGWQ
jgi:hypothetical protein